MDFKLDSLDIEDSMILGMFSKMSPSEFAEYIIAHPSDYSGCRYLSDLLDDNNRIDQIFDELSKRGI